MVICPNCKQQLPDGLIFCTNCGAALPQTPPSAPANMNDAALNGSIVAPPAPNNPSADPNKISSAPNNRRPLIIALVAGAALLVITIVIVLVVVLTSRSSTIADYTIPTADEITPSTTTTAWLGNYFFTIPDTYNFELGVDYPYEAIYLQKSGSSATVTEILYADDIPFTTIASGNYINDRIDIAATDLDATSHHVSATTVRNINFYYMEFTTEDGTILMAFSPADDSSFLTTVVSDQGTVEDRLADAAVILSTVQKMRAADKGVPDNVGDIVNSGLIIDAFLEED